MIFAKMFREVWQATRVNVTIMCLLNIPRKLCTVATKYLLGDSAADENKPKNDKITIKY